MPASLINSSANGANTGRTSAQPRFQSYAATSLINNTTPDVDVSPSMADPEVRRGSAKLDRWKLNKTVKISWKSATV